MKDVNHIIVPTDESEDGMRELTTWRNGRLVAVDEGTHVTLYVDHYDYTQIEPQAEGAEEEPQERTVTRAFAIRVQKPLSRDAAINAAEMEAYQLRSAMEVASFTASLARKYRDNPNDAEVREHDEFIAWVKDELSKIGV
jgi:hypothetical protein